jgi:K+ transporter
MSDFLLPFIGIVITVVVIIWQQSKRKQLQVVPTQEASLLQEQGININEVANQLSALSMQIIPSDAIWFGTDDNSFGSFVLKIMQIAISAKEAGWFIKKANRRPWIIEIRSLSQEIIIDTRNLEIVGVDEKPWTLDEIEEFLDNEKSKKRNQQQQQQKSGK